METLILMYLFSILVYFNSIYHNFKLVIFPERTSKMNFTTIITGVVINYSINALLGGLKIIYYRLRFQV